MPVALLPTLLLQLFVVGFSPGPANLYSLSCSLKYGKKRALNMWKGLLCGFLVAAMLVVLLLHYLGLAIEQYVDNLRYVGAVYLLWLAVNMLLHKGKATSTDHECTFLNGFLVQLTNSKMLLFELSVYSSFVLPYTTALSDMLKTMLLLLIAGPGANLVWLLLPGENFRGYYDKHHLIFDVGMSLCLVLCAILIVFQ